mmetsp:Transcript_101891/g.160696  ORF Transcript_101891/g.160696 Transcript_101891/m.160696 type:complete len:86 (-) Transcript_101891:26-283(-)
MSCACTFLEGFYAKPRLAGVQSAPGALCEMVSNPSSSFNISPSAKDAHPAAAHTFAGVALQITHETVRKVSSRVLMSRLGSVTLT